MKQRRRVDPESRDDAGDRMQVTGDFAGRRIGTAADGGKSVVHARLGADFAAEVGWKEPVVIA